MSSYFDLQHLIDVGSRLKSSFVDVAHRALCCSAPPYRPTCRRARIEEEELALPTHSIDVKRQGSTCLDGKVAGESCIRPLLQTLEKTPKW
jgi:hypothetical protein